MFITLQFTILISLFLLLLMARYIQKSNWELEERPVGVGKGIVFLLGQSIGLTTFLASSQASYEYGVIGLLGYCLAGVASLLFIYVLLKNNVGSANGKTNRLLVPFTFLYQLENIVIAILAGKMIVKLFYGLNIVVVLCLIVIFYQFMYLSKNKNFYIGSLLIVILALTSTVLIPTLVYLKVSVPTVYSGVNFLATEMLVLDDPGIWLIAIVLFSRFSAHNLLNRNLWGIYQKVKQTKRALSFTLSSFIWLFLPLSIGTLPFVARASAVWPALNDEVSLAVVHHFGGQLGVALLVVTLIVLIFSSASIYVVQTYGKFDVVLKVAITILAGVMTAILPELTMLDLIFYFSFIWAAMIPIVLFVRQDAVSSLGLLVVVIVSITTGAYFTVYHGLTIGIIFDFLMALSVMLIYSIIKRFK